MLNKNLYMLLSLVVLVSSCSSIIRNDPYTYRTTNRLHLSGEVLCVPPYGKCDVEGSSGDVTMTSNIKIGIINLRIETKCLIKNKEYSVYLMSSDQPWEKMDCDYGPWQKLGSFTTDSSGNGIYQIRMKDINDISKNDFYSVWINDTESAGTSLVSDSFKLFVFQ